MHPAHLSSQLKTALVHYWLMNRRGGEAVLDAIERLIPQEHLYSHVVDRDVLFGSLAAVPMHTTAISRLPGRAKPIRPTWG
jgi:hypothetical protein